MVCNSVECPYCKEVVEMEEAVSKGFVVLQNEGVDVESVFIYQFRCLECDKAFEVHIRVPIAKGKNLIIGMDPIEEENNE